MKEGSSRVQETTLKGGGLDLLSPVDRETAQDRVYGQLRRALILGSFDAGEAFLVGDVAARMSVSSMPVREALARLVSESALEAMPNRRVRVPLLSARRARDILRARTMIEGDLASSALLSITDEDVVYLKSLIEDHNRCTDAGKVAFLNHAFHFRIYERAKSSVFFAIAESLWMQAGPFVRAAVKLHKPEVDELATLHHSGILKAIQKRDAILLVDELTADIAGAFDILERASEPVWDIEDDAAND